MQRDCMPIESNEKENLNLESSSITTSPQHSPSPRPPCPPERKSPNKTAKRKAVGDRVTKPRRRKPRPIRHIDILMTQLFTTLTVTGPKT